MAYNFNKSRHFIDNNFCFKTFIIATFAFLTTIGLINCSSKSKISDKKTIPFLVSTKVFTQWYDIFEDGEIVPLTFENPNLEVFKIGDMLVSPTGDYFILDGKARKVIQFDESGKFVRFIGKHGEGPGEYSLPARPYLDKDKNLYIYDPFIFRISRYVYPKYTFERHFQLKVPIQDFILDTNNNFITYTISDPQILHKINIKGEVSKKVFKPNQIKFRLFSSRFQIGLLSNIPGEGFLFSYPEEYKIYFFDYEFNIKKVLYVKTNSQFFPEKAEFPNSLSPYDFTPKHSKWWCQSLRPGMVYYLGNGIVIYVLLRYTNLSVKFYVNIHSLDGFTYAMGVEVPFEGIIRYTKDNYIYVVEDSKFDKNGRVVPLKLHRFKLRNNLKEKLSRM